MHPDLLGGAHTRLLARQQSDFSLDPPLALANSRRLIRHIFHVNMLKHRMKQDVL